MDSAVYHDYFNIAGGGERLVLTLSRLFAMPVVTAFASTSLFSQVGWSFSAFQLAPMLLRLPPLLHPPAASLCFALQAAKKAPASRRAVFSGNFAPLAARDMEGSRKIFYCHSPPRFLYDLKNFSLSRIPRPARLFYRFFLKIYERSYQASVNRMDVILANSENVRSRIERFLGRKACVVYPPCDVEGFRWRRLGDFYLSTARLDPAKNVERIVEAFRKLPGKRLVVVSGGAEFSAIRRKALSLPNVKVLGWVGEVHLKRLVGSCLATIYVPTDEDFGISPVESMAAGKPVIGVAQGGLLETVVHGETGLLLKPGWKNRDLVEAVNQMTLDVVLSMRKACEARARLFGVDVFRRRMEMYLA